MNSSLDPLAASERIERDYRSYLTTSFAPLDPALQSDFISALSEPGRLRRGPFLQATPPYQPGRSVGDLVAEGMLADSFLQAGRALTPERPLYRHQETALRTAGQGMNMIVATGTGSGKTECYLLPILDHLLREREAGTIAQPGVRAMLLYPMNALANDQMKRIRELFAPYPELTFGRYVGDTKHTYDKAVDAYRRQMQTSPQPGELIDRQTMQARPPHVLLTNFAMLEYLLLRPGDSSLFDGPTGSHWKFIVLDEVHVYDGAKGAEVGMLLRRVRDRVHQSRRGLLRCIGTSATLGGGERDSAAVATFASTLFDEPFDATGVIHPTRLPLRQGTSTWSLTEDRLAALHNGWTAGASADELARAADRSLQFAPATTPSSALWSLLHDEDHVVDLQRALEDGSRSLQSLSEVMAEMVDPLPSLVRLIDLCVAARPDESSASLIPARYHLWLRASEGNFVCLHPDHHAAQTRIRLDRFESCPDCARNQITAQMNELAVCRHCRRHLIVGKIHQNFLQLGSGFERDLVYFVPGEQVPTDDYYDEDEEALEGSASLAGAARKLCLSCRHLATGNERCRCERPTRIVVTQLNRAGEPLRRCPVCERRTKGGIGLRFLSGSEAPVSVIATSLYQSLPPVANASPDASAEGRKLLMFSDSRQDAAFFAPYLSRTYSRAIERRLLWQRLHLLEESVSFDDLVQPVRRHAERLGVLDPDDGAKNAAAVKAWLLAELIATDRRQSLDGVGLAEISVPIPSTAQPPEALLSIGLTSVEAFDVVRVLLDTVRQSASVTVPDEVNVTEDQRFAPRNTSTWLRGFGSEPGVLSWLPTSGSNRRLDYLERLLERRGCTEPARQILESLWQELTASDGPYRKVLKSFDVRQHGTVFALDHERILFTGRHAGAVPHRCTVCRQMSWRSVDGVCPTYRCSGHLELHDSDDADHYRQLYLGLAPLPLKVEEHTGQLRAERAAELQEQFTRGQLNALSCSTTFELGVDVGEVQAVLMRNVPPSPANYVQRAGRAGRRLGSAALVVSFAQRRSHDRSFYDNPRSMIDGIVPAPFISIDNETIVRRHVHAVAFAQFERERVAAGAAPVETMGDLLSAAPNSIADRFRAWLLTHPSELQATLKRLLPAGHEYIGLDDWRWVDQLLHPDEAGVGGWFTTIVEGLQHDLDELEHLETEASAERKHHVAQALQRAQRTLRERRVLERFAQGGVLPKYGFPVDVVELDLSTVQSGQALDLNRDLRLGILEFAPGAQVVAASKLWRSIGVKLMPGRELPRRHWGICEGCGCLRTEFAVDDDDDALSDPCEYCGSDQFAAGRRGEFITPIFGFVGDADSAKPGESRPPREGFLETFFAEFDGPSPEPEIVQLGGAPLSIRMSRRGWITVFNRGRSGHGFWYCSWCGHAQDSPPSRSKKNPDNPKHNRPRTNRECKGRLSQVDLGHRFLTNVMELDLPLSIPGFTQDVTALSALHALIAAAPAIGVTQNDIGGSLGVGANGQRVLVVFDDVPGGAGYSRHLRANLSELVEAAVARVLECSCGADTSCYGCLRSFRNQQSHDQLVRQAAISVLQPLLGG